MTQRPTRFLNFTNEEDINLINLVKQYRSLYDVYEKEHKDLMVRNQLWHDVARIMERDVSDCKKRWRSMKDTYYRQKRTKTRTNWVLMNRLQFLDAVGKSYDW
ncbi:hypothetical protein HHI36_017259 [Cryptolaemus montrouzieri]|uniref:MADF domain-containing protein n=1 Tax=Cryptolaemus montrouzieri TaxID=559131 RepID=A0ABD2NLX5_9CUCU